jgi:gliding motility-associated-like protein
MKKIITFIVLVISFAGAAQAVTISTSKTPIQLVNEVLISAPCFQAFNVTAGTGSTFPLTSTNGIGYFENIDPSNPMTPPVPFNANFPFTSGVVITSGDVTKVPSPNSTLLSDGSTAWPGDNDLQVALAGQGVTMNSVNATKLEFDFIAKQTTFDLSFIFASEEYGEFQCNFSDAFAFLIKDVTAGGAYQNLATVPANAPPNTPITVATIRDATYNPNCSSVNPQFFGAYNGSGFGPAINFNGQTVPMIASAQLIFNHTYHVKLVVADGNNNVGSDSAIFLQAKSVNIGGQVLGLDYIATNASAGRSALCIGSTYPTLQPTVPLEAGTTYAWEKLTNSGWASLIGVTTSSYDLNTVWPVLPTNLSYLNLAPGLNSYRLKYKIIGCAVIEDQIDVFLYPAINSLAVVPPLSKCSNPTAIGYTYDLTKTTDIIIQNNTPQNPFDNLSGVSITYHTSNQNAVDGIAVGNSITITPAQAQAGFNMWAKIKNNNSGCYEIRQFQLTLVPPPTIVAPPLDMTACGDAPSPAPRANFDFNANLALILGTQDPTIYSFSFYDSFANADAGGTLGTIFVPITNIKNTTSDEIFIRLQNKLDPDCYVITSFMVTVTPLNYVDILPDVIVCNSFVLPALTQVGAQYWSLINGTGIQYSVGDPITPGATPTTIYVFNSNGTCFTNDSFKITKASVTGATSIAPPSASFCGQYSLPGLAYGVYYKNPGGPGANPGGTTPAGTIVSTTGPNDYYVWFESPTESCTQEKPFTITIITIADLPPYDNEFSCSSYILPAAGNGATYYNGPGKSGGSIATGASIASTKTIWVYKETGTTPNCFTETSFDVVIGIADNTDPKSDVISCASYPLPTLSFGQYCMGPNGASPYPANAVISAIGETTVYYFIPGQPCTANLSFKVNVSLLPLDPIADLTVCDSFTFPVVAGHPNGKYYTTSGAPSGPFRTQGETIYTVGAQTYYFKEAGTGGCYVEEPFLLTIYSTPAISQRPPLVQRCNQAYVLDDLAFGEFYKNPGGLSASNPVLPALTSLTINDPGQEYNEIFAYAGSTQAGNACFQEYSIKIYFVNTNVDPSGPFTACDTYPLPTPAIGDYYTMSGGPLVPGNQKIILPKNITTTTTLYVYAENNNRLPCSDEEPFTVNIVNTPDLNALAAKSVCGSYTVPQYNDPMFTFTATHPGVVTKFYRNAGGAFANPLATDVYTPGQVITNTNADFSPLVISIYPYTEALGTGVTCYDDELFEVTINRTPVIVPTEVNDRTACDSYSLPALTIGKYYSAATHLPGEELLVGYTITNTTAPTTVYVYAETGTTPNCFAPVEDFEVTIVATPIVSAIAPVSSCDTYTMPQYADAMFTSTNPITKFYKNAGGPVNNPLPSDEYAEGAIITAGPNPTIVTIYAYSAVGSVPCFDDEPFVVTINKSPVIVAAEVLPISRCDSYTLPALTVGSYFSDALHTTPITDFLLTGTQTIYVYAETATNPNCTDSDSFAVTIVPTPTVNPIAPIASCDTYIVPSYSNPMFTSTSPITKFYKNAGGPTANPLPSDEYTVGQIIQNTTTTPLVVTIYAYTQVGSVPCFANAPLVVTINKSPVIVPSEVVAITKCDSYTLPNLTIGNYFSNASHTNPISSLTLTTSQTVYVYAENGIMPNVCSDSASFLVTINNTPQFTIAEVANVSKCNSYTLPTLSIPGAKYFEGPNGTGNEIVLPKTYTSDALIYAYANTGTTPDCAKSEDIVISIYNVIELPDVTICGGYTLPNLADANANYYAFSGGAGQIAAGTTLTTSQTVFVRGIGPSGCADESDFVVTINGQPIANDASDTVCDNDSSPFDGITPYDLTTLIPSILGASQLPTDFTVTFYADFNRTVQIIDPTTCTLPIVYVFVTNNLSTTCPSPAIVTISVIPLPDPKLDVPPICIDSETGIVTNSVIESGYNSVQYSIVWTKADGTVVSNSQTFSTDVPGDYILNVASNAVTTCASAPVPFTVIESAKPAVTPPITFDITGWFTNSQTITVNATPYVGDGSNFAYSLDGQTPQDDNVFYNVGPGPHEITVIDKNGCGTRSLPIPVELVTSPAAFTPNGDGINDRWDIKGDISYSTLSIFDRFGRLLKQLNQNSGGWDGTINSQTLPADDYWFSVNYVDSSGATREYKSHFSLIR